MVLVVQEILQTDKTFIKEIKDKADKYKHWLLHNLESLTTDQEFYLQFQFEKLDQFYQLVKEYANTVEDLHVDQSNYDECVELIVSNLLDWLDNDKYVETFVINSSTVGCEIWNGLYSRIETTGMMVNYYFISRLARYVLLHKELNKNDNVAHNEKINLLLEKLELKVNLQTQNYSILSRVKKNVDFLKSTQLFLFDNVLVGVKFEIFNSSTTESQKFDEGAILISKLGELFLLKKYGNDRKEVWNILESDSLLHNDVYEYELEKVVDIKNVRYTRLIYEENSIHINSKHFQIIISFNKKNNQVSTWKALTMKRQRIPTYFELQKIRKYYDMSFNLELA